MGESAFEVGQHASISRKVTAEAVEAFAKATGDVNPIHLDEAYAAETRFGRRIAHGMLVASYVSTLLGTKFPGPGTIYVSQGFSFLKPVFLGDTLDISATVAKYRPDRGILTLEIAVQNQRAEKVLTGEAVCLVTDVATGQTARSGAAAG
jgi:3-hydroxybutyryl-CoA dehydratase